MHAPEKFPSPEVLGPSQSSATSAGLSASNAEDDLTVHHKLSLAKAKSRPKKSLRLKAKADKPNEGPASPHVHRYDTRNQPLTRAQKREMTRKSKPTSSVKRQKSVLMPRKGSRPPSLGVRATRQARKAERDEEANSVLESLRANSPLDEMSLNLKKRLAVYLSLTQYYSYWGWESRENVEDFVTDMLDLKSSSVHRWCIEYEAHHFLEEGRRGKHSKVRSPLYDAEYASFRERFRDYVKNNSLGQAGQPNLTADALADWVNLDLQLNGEDK